MNYFKSAWNNAYPGDRRDEIYRVFGCVTEEMEKNIFLTWDQMNKDIKDKLME